MQLSSVVQKIFITNLNQRCNQPRSHTKGSLKVTNVLRNSNLLLDDSRDMACSRRRFSTFLRVSVVGHAIEPLQSTITKFVIGEKATYFSTCKSDSLAQFALCSLHCALRCRMARRLLRASGESPSPIRREDR